MGQSAQITSQRVGILVVGHGSREPLANAQGEAVAKHLAAACTRYTVLSAYIELASPSVEEGLHTLAQQCDRVVVLPLLLFAAGHVKNDLPLSLARLRAEYPHVDFVAAPALGVHPELIAIAAARAHAALPKGPRGDGKIAVVVVGRGSSDADANGDFCKAARLLGEGQGWAWTLPCFVGITTPRVDDALELAARSRPDVLLVLPYMLFHGRLISQLHTQVQAFAQKHPWIAMAQSHYLEPGARLVPLLLDRIEGALQGARPLPCDTCQYRTSISAVATQVGGLNALLWSVRHSLTHTQSMPHEHAHRPLRKHVLVCGNVDCAKGGSIALINALRRKVKAAGLQNDIRVTRTSCMGRCGEGPTVAVYPDGIWYRAVREADAPELVDEHLLQDRLVSRLVDNIMQ